MTLLRFSGVSDRGPSGKLWQGLVDWTKGTLAVSNGVVDVDDFWPYNAGNFTLSGDSGSAATVTAVPFGVLSITATQAADAVSGYQRNSYVDLTSIREVCIETSLDPTDDNDTTQTFVGFTDEALDGFFGSDNTPDGSAIGVRWNGDETFDLIAIDASDVITVLADAFATVARTAGNCLIGCRIKRTSATNYQVIGSVNGATVKVNTTSSVVPQVAMLPSVIHTNDNEAAPLFTNDWVAVIDYTPA